MQIQYNDILFKTESISEMFMKSLSLQITMCAKFLKTKFSDTRTIPELELLIREEYRIM